MKLVVFTLFFGTALLSARADLTLVQKIEGAGSNNEMTMKIKGDKMRIDINPRVTTIIDAKTGEMTNLLNDQKAVVRMSAEKVKAAMEMARQFNAKNESKESGEKPKLVATGKKEMVNGYGTELYTYETPNFKASYWIAPKYPDGAVILKQLQTINPEVWKTSNAQIPDYREFPSLPIKTVISISGKQITTTLIDAKKDPLDAADFAIPKDYQEIKLPEMSGQSQSATPPPASASPKP